MKIFLNAKNKEKSHLLFSFADRILQLLKQFSCAESGDMNMNNTEFENMNVNDTEFENINVNDTEFQNMFTHMGSTVKSLEI